MEGQILKILEIFSWIKGLGPGFAGHSITRVLPGRRIPWESPRIGICLLNRDGSIFVYTVSGGLRMIRR